MKYHLSVLCFVLFAFNGIDLIAQNAVFSNQAYILKNNTWYIQAQDELQPIILNRIILRHKLRMDLHQYNFDKGDFRQSPQISKRLFGGYYVIDVPNGSFPFQVIQRIRNTKDFDFVEFDIAGIQDKIPNDSIYTTFNQWNLDSIDCRSAWDITTGDSTIIVGVIDTGTKRVLDELANNLWINESESISYPDGIDNDNNGYVDDVNGWNFDAINGNNDLSDDISHGTQVTSILGARSNNITGISGIAGGWNDRRGVSLMILKYNDSDDYVSSLFQVGTFSGNLPAIR